MIDDALRRRPQDLSHRAPDLEPTPVDDPHRTYSEAFAQHDARHRAAARRSLRLSNLRGATFLAAATAWFVPDVLPDPWARVMLVVAMALTLAFVWLIVVHRRVQRVERWEAALAGLAREGMLRLERNWEDLAEALPEAERAVHEPDADHPYATDLSVVGSVALARLAGPVTSERGRAILRGWLLDGGDPEAATARQGAVRELTGASELRTHFAAQGRLRGPKALVGLERFFTWAEGEPTGLARPGLLLSAWLLPPFLIVGLVGYFVLAWPPWWIVPAVAHFWILKKVGPETKRAFEESVLGGPPLRALVPQLDLLGGREWRDPTLVSIADRLGDGETDARRHLKSLSKLLDSVESRRNAFYAMVAPILLLEIHLWMALERWRDAHGQAARQWIEALGEWEALSALATLAHDQPDWSYPAFTPGASEVRATALGHPLLEPGLCVRNDVAVGPPGTFLFVTGSNMSGKSTLLRALGANAVLAGTGAPVCAESLSLPPVRVHTSMRIEDSLAEGISLFMAELLRIKKVVEAADAGDPERPVFYLLDEILHGTNTAERRIAARGVLRHLLASGAIGAISSHDLLLAEAPDLKRAAHAVHFREEVGAGEGPHDGGRTPSLTFDYELREGVATTRNALKLLEAVGLGGLELEEEDGP